MGALSSGFAFENTGIGQISAKIEVNAIFLCTSKLDFQSPISGGLIAGVTSKNGEIRIVYLSIAIMMPRGPAPAAVGGGEQRAGQQAPPNAIFLRFYSDTPK